jgi:phosphoribosylaminoimidazole carboxylase (NCAIR synthetase)
MWSAERETPGTALLVAFVAPVLSPAATQMLAAAVEEPGVRVAVVSQDPVDRLEPSLAARLAGHWQVPDVTRPDRLREALAALADRLGPIARAFGAFEQLQHPLALVREALGIPGLSSVAAHRFRDKAAMKDALRAAGVPVARHAVIGSGDEVAAAVAAVGFPLVLKPLAGAGARATHRVAGAAQLAQVLAEMPPGPQSPWLAEEMLLGTEHSLESVSVRGTVVWQSITRYAPTPLEVLENPWIQWTVVLPREVDGPGYDDIRATGARALAALGMDTGVSHCEWFRRPDGTLAISEIAARPPGANMTTMISRATDTDFVASWVRLLLRGTFERPERKYAVGTAYLRGQGAGRVVAVEGLDVVQRELGGLVCDRRLPRPGAAPTGSYEGEGFIMVRHPDTAVVEQAVRHIVSTVRVRLG